MIFFFLDFNRKYVILNIVGEDMNYVNEEFFQNLKSKCSLVKKNMVKTLVMVPLSVSLVLGGTIPTVAYNYQEYQPYYDEDGNPTNRTENKTSSENEKESTSEKITTPSHTETKKQSTQQETTTTKPIKQESTTVNTQPSKQESVTTNTNQNFQTSVNFSTSSESSNFLNQIVSLSKEEGTSFANKVHNRPVTYKNSEYFGVDEALTRYENLKAYQSNVTFQIIQNGKINENLLKQKILANNEQCVGTNHYIRYKELSKSDFDKVFQALVDGLNTYLKDEIDIAKLEEKLNNLKIFEMGLAGSGVVSDEGDVLAVNLKVIAVQQKYYPQIDYLRFTVIHEASHLIQVNSLQEKNEQGWSRNYGIAYEWEDLKVNPLMNNWYVEGAAEDLAINHENVSDIPGYVNDVKAIQSLTVATIVRDDIEEDTISKLSLQSDLDKWFEVFNCKTKEDKKEIINMMFSFDIWLNQNRDFYDYYQSQTGKDLDRSTYEISLKSSIAQTLTKQFYENLSSKIVTSNVPLKDIFSSIEVFEMEMSRITWYASRQNTDNAIFVKMYQEIQDEFFDILAKKVHTNKSEIYNLYNSYYRDSQTNVIDNIMLNKEENDYMSKVMESRSTLKSKSGPVNQLSPYR